MTLGVVRERSKKAHEHGDEKEIDGVVDEVLLAKKGYSVIRAMTLFGPVIVAGEGSLEEGQSFKALGSWNDHPRYGRQFKAAALLPSRPKSLEALVAFFGSGRGENIGSVFAQKVVNYYGESLFEILDGPEAEALSRLQRVPGVGALRAREFVRIWAEEADYRDMVEFCVEAGLTAKDAAKLQGEGISLSMLKRDPYALMRLPRADFLKVDRLALKSGIDPHGTARLSAASAHILRLWCDHGGHTSMELTAYLRAFRDLLPDLVDIEPKELLLKSRALLVGRESPVSGSAYCVARDTTEKSVAENLRLRFLSKAHPKVSSAPPVIRVQRPGIPDPITLAPEQAEAVRRALANPLHILSGGPGTGKTTIIKAYVDWLIHTGVVGLPEVCLCAPTGRAADRLGKATGMYATTIHRAIYGTEEAPPDASRARVLIVDECSMIDAKLMLDLLKTAPISAKILFVGDPYQLPSISPGKVLSDMIQSQVIPTSTLSTIHRQANESAIPDVAAAVKQGKKPLLFNQPGVRFIPTPDAVATAQDIETRVSQYLGAGGDIRDFQILTCMHKGPAGTIALNEAIQDIVLPPHTRGKGLVVGDLTFFTGDKIMQTKNDYKLEVMNGETGIVTELRTSKDATGMVVEFDDGRSVEYGKDDLDYVRKAYAITYHKSQGSEYKTVCLAVDISQSFMLERHLLYTGITRGKDTLIIVGQEKALQMAIHTEKADKRETLLQAFLQERALERTVLPDDVARDHDKTRAQEMEEWIL